MAFPTGKSLLERFCMHWEETTGMRICIYDFGYFSLENDRLGLPYKRRTHCSAHCTLVKTSPEAADCCTRTETWRAQQAAKAGERAAAFVHRCHAGVSDLIVPIRLGMRVIGAVFMGQAAPASARLRATYVRRMARTWSLSEVQLSRAMEKLPVVTPQSLAAFADSARFIADYIRQTLSMVATESLADAQVVRDSQGRIMMDKVPNYFLDRLSANPGAMKDALAYIREHYWRDLDQPQVAAHVGVSESHFSRLFRQAAGMPFRRCLVEARLSAAAWLVKKTDLKIREIADLLNYRDTSSLQRALRTHAGITPRALRDRQPMPWHMDRIELMPEIVARRKRKAR